MSDDLLKQDFQADKPLEKCVTDITGIKAKDGKLYVRATFDCFNLTVRAGDGHEHEGTAVRAHTARRGGSLSALQGAVVHSDRGSQYTSGAYQAAVEQYGIRQSMNSDGGRCHDNARCESMWARMNSEIFYDRLDPERPTVEELKSMIWRYCMSCWCISLEFRIALYFFAFITSGTDMGSVLTFFNGLDAACIAGIQAKILGILLTDGWTGNDDVVQRCFQKFDVMRVCTREDNRQRKPFFRRFPPAPVGLADLAVLVPVLSADACSDFAAFSEYTL